MKTIEYGMDYNNIVNRTLIILMKFNNIRKKSIDTNDLIHLKMISVTKSLKDYKFALIGCAIALFVVVFWLSL